MSQTQPCRYFSTTGQCFYGQLLLASLCAWCHHWCVCSKPRLTQRKQGTNCNFLHVKPAAMGVETPHAATGTVWCDVCVVRWRDSSEPRARTSARREPSPPRRCARDVASGEWLMHRAGASRSRVSYSMKQRATLTASHSNGRAAGRAESLCSGHVCGCVTDTHADAAPLTPRTQEPRPSPHHPMVICAGSCCVHCLIAARAVAALPRPLGAPAATLPQPWGGQQLQQQPPSQHYQPQQQFVPVRVAPGSGTHTFLHRFRGFS